MLNPKEEAFLKYWGKNRTRQKRIFYQVLVGLPLGLLIGVIIIANFFSGWYKRADMIANSSFNPAILYLAVALIAVFFAVFSKKFQWEQQEQRYRELLAKKEKLNRETGASGESEQRSKEKSEN